MPKRKLSDLQTPRHHHPSNAHLTAHLSHHLTLLHRALKSARAAERQKLGRRAKTAAAEKKLDDIRRLRVEVVELKALDLVKVAEIHLSKGLVKIKAIAESRALDGVLLKEKVGEGMEERVCVERMNVLARLFRSEGVRRVVREAVDGVVNLLGAEKGIGKMEVGRRRARARDYIDGGAGGGAEGRVDRHAASADEGVADPMHINDDDDDEEEAEEEGEEEEQDWDGFSSPAHSQSSLRLEAEAEAEEDDNASFSSVDGDSNNSDYEHYASRLAASSSSPSDSESEYPSDSAGQCQPAVPRPRHRTLPSSSSKQIAKSKPTKTTFLPSLLTSGYYSGASSDGSSIEDSPTANGAAAPARRNRMGQQARRALWEKKFKDRARHLRDRPVGETGGGVNEARRKGGRDRRDEDWDGRKGARSSNGGVGVRGKGRREGRKKGPTGANGDVVGVGRGSVSGKARTKTEVVAGVGPRKGGGDGPLHPSWEAARRAKEMKIGVKPVGRKVVF